jgi:hypothetical protein
MRPGRHWRAGLVTLALACAVLAVAVAVADPIGPAGYRRIRAGMTKDEAVAAVGLRPGDHHHTIPPGYALVDYVPPPERWGAGARCPDGGFTEEWVGDGYRLIVAFDRDGKAVGASLAKSAVSDYSRRTFAARLRYWLGGVRARLGL